MNREGIETFLAVIETGTVTAAASRLFVTQATVSKRLDQLEEEVGAPLMMRSRGTRRVELTPQGQEFAPLARQWSALEHDMRAIHERRERTPMAVAGTDSLNEFAFAEPLRAFVRENPDVRLNLESHHTDEVHSLVEQRVADIGYAYAPARYPDLVSTPVYREALHVICPAGSGLPERIDPAQLDVEREVHMRLGPAFEEWYERYWPLGRYRLQVAPAAMTPRFLDEPGSWSIVPSCVAEQLRQTADIEQHDLTVAMPQLMCYCIEPRHVPARVAPSIERLKRCIASHIEQSSALNAFEPWMLGDATTIARL